MADNRNFIAGLLIGAAAGTALALFLQSDKGKEILSGMKNLIDEAGDNLKDHFKELDDEMKRILQKGRQFADDIENKIKDETFT